jgi:hypothetical protein
MRRFRGRFPWMTLPVSRIIQCRVGAPMGAPCLYAARQAATKTPQLIPMRRCLCHGVCCCPSQRGGTLVSSKRRTKEPTRTCGHEPVAAARVLPQAEAPVLDPMSTNRGRGEPASTQPTFSTMDLREQRTRLATLMACHRPLTCRGMAWRGALLGITMAACLAYRTRTGDTHNRLVGRLGVAATIRRRHTMVVHRGLFGLGLLMVTSPRAAQRGWKEKKGRRRRRWRG